MLAGLAVACGLGLVTAPAPRLEVAVGRGAERGARLHVVKLGPEAVSAVHASDPIELGG